MTGLSARLARLRAQAGGDRPGLRPGLTPDGGVAARLARMERVRRGGERALAARLGARVVAPGLLALEAEVRAPAALARAPLEALPEGAGLAPERLVFLDTETTGLAGGTGTTVFLLGMARLRSGRLELRQLLLTAFAGERALHGEAAAWLSEAVLVSYNGRSFDVPVLAARSRIAGMPDVCAGRPHLDLLHAVRRAFGRRLGDCRLARVEAEILGRPRRGDLPGSEAPAAWLEYLRAGGIERLCRVVEHNRRDVLVLAELLAHLAAAHAEPQAHGADSVAVARGLARAGRMAEACRILEGAGERPEVLRLLAELHRRLGRPERARPLWERLAARGDAGAVERLAKYHEHVCGDFASALAWAERLPPGAARERRCARLRRRMASSGGRR